MSGVELVVAVVVAVACSGLTVGVEVVVSGTGTVEMVELEATACLWRSGRYDGGIG